MKHGSFHREKEIFFALVLFQNDFNFFNTIYTEHKTPESVRRTILNFHIVYAWTNALHTLFVLLPNEMS
jgi:hypothetical protein